MSFDPQLSTHLKQLRLGGMLETLDVRMHQAVTEQLSYMDFLQLLLEDELSRRHHKQLTQRIRRANFQTDKTIERFDFSFNPHLNRQLILELATCHFVTRHQPVLIIGPSGVGKSHLSQALGWEACKRGYDVVYTSCAKVLSSLAAGRADGSYDKRLQALARPDLLILDDFGLQQLDSTARLILLEIIEDRHGRKSTIISSQLPVAKWYDIIGDSTVADAILDRMVHTSHRLELKGESLRKK